MPAYSFQERFVPMVLDGTKPHTIRQRRKKGFAKKGDTLYLYYGLRTKYCRKLREDICTDVKTILIAETATTGSLIILLYDQRFTDDEFFINEDHSVTMNTKQSPILLTCHDADDLAWKDGFRPDESSEKNTKGAGDLMLRWWRQTHQLPFIGDIIYWQPK